MNSSATGTTFIMKSAKRFTKKRQSPKLLVWIALKHIVWIALQGHKMLKYWLANYLEVKSCFQAILGLWKT